MTSRATHAAVAPLRRRDATRSNARRRRLVRNAIAITGFALLGTTIVASPAPRLVWNASASAPIGLYAVSPGTVPGRGDMVIAWLPSRYRGLAATRGYLPRNVPLVKRVAGVDGDRVCAIGDAIFVNGARVAVRRAADPRGRILPRWTGCVDLREGQLFLLIAGTPASFDGRYFGVTAAADVIGRARLIWRR